MSEQLTSEQTLEVMKEVAKLAAHPDFQDADEMNKILKKTLDDLLPDHAPRALNAFRHGMRTQTQIPWPTILTAKPIKLVEMCSDFLSNEDGDEEPAEKPKKAPKKAKPAAKKAPKKEPKKAEPAEEPAEPQNDVAAEQEEPAAEEAPKKKPKNRRRKPKPKEPEVATPEAEETEEEPKLTKSVTVSPKQEVSLEVVEQGFANELMKKLTYIESGLSEVMTRLQDLEDDVKDHSNKVGTFVENEHFRIRAMTQELWMEMRKMLMDEDYVPPQKLDEGK